MLTIAPPCSPIQARCASCTQASAPSALTSTILRAAPRSMSISGPATGLMPALLTSRSRLPNVSMVRRTASARCSGSSALPATAIAWSGPPRAATASSSASGLRAVRQTRAPSSTSRWAMPRPMPRLAPVTIATLPASPCTVLLALPCRLTKRLLTMRLVSASTPASTPRAARCPDPAGPGRGRGVRGPGLPRHHDPRHLDRGRDEPGRALRAPPLQGGAALRALAGSATSGCWRWCGPRSPRSDDPVEQLGTLVEDFVRDHALVAHRRPGHQLRARRAQRGAPGRDRGDPARHRPASSATSSTAASPPASSTPRTPT